MSELRTPISRKIVATVKLVCHTCNVTYHKMPQEIRADQKKTFCSTECYTKDRVASRTPPPAMSPRKPARTTEVRCSKCDSLFEKKEYLVMARNYCSTECAAGEEVPTAGDPDKLKIYMRDYSAKNRARINELAREWTAKNREKRNEIQRAYRLRKKAETAARISVRRDRVRNGDFSKADWESMKERYEYRCLCCKKQEPEIRLEADHVVPIMDGGEHTESNIQPLCSHCNRTKNKRTIDYR